MKRFWVSWYDTCGGKYELHSPWWRSGFRMGGADGETEEPTVCAAIEATDEDAAKAAVIAAHDEPRPDDLEWRFVEERPDDWSPYCDRFRAAPWMKWATSEKAE